MVEGRQPVPPPPLQPLVPSLPKQLVAPHNLSATENPVSQSIHGAPQDLKTQTQLPISPRTQKKSFLSVTLGEKSAIITLNREPFLYRDRPTVCFYDDEIITLAQPF